jgi:hypothetical protein
VSTGYRCVGVVLALALLGHIGAGQRDYGF